jgi:Proline utilization A proline dehydrogenase N-terminal domain
MAIVQQPVVQQSVAQFGCTIWASGKWSEPKDTVVAPSTLHPSMQIPARAAEPFAAFVGEVQVLTPLRAAICEAYRAPEPDCVRLSLPAATLSRREAERANALARSLVESLRAKRQLGGVQALMREYALSGDEGVALMCLAETLFAYCILETGDWRLAWCRCLVCNWIWHRTEAEMPRLENL